MAKPSPSERILVVEDEPGVRAALSRVLGRVGYTLLGVGTGEEGLEALQVEDFACGIVDLRMPGMGGYGFIRRARQLQPAFPVVVLSGHGDKNDVIECLRLGVADFVSKPWSDTELRSAVLRALDGGPRARIGASSSSTPAAGRPTPIGLTPVGLTPVGAAPAEAAPAPRDEFAASALAAIREGAIPFPPVPEVAMEARVLASSEAASAARMKEVVEREPHLAARIVHISNSPYFLGYGRVTELRSAIARIGFRQISNLLDTLIAHRLYVLPLASPEGREAIGRIWRHAWARGVAMRFIAQQRSDLGISPDWAYLAGLFADVGAPFLLRSIAEVESAPFTEILGAAAEHHAEVGEIMARAYQLPEACSLLARRHHDSMQLEHAEPILLCAWAAEAVCAQLGLTGDPKPVPYSEEAARLLNFTPAGRAVLVGKTNAFLEELGQSIEVGPES